MICKTLGLIPSLPKREPTITSHARVCAVTWKLDDKNSSKAASSKACLPTHAAWLWTTTSRDVAGFPCATPSCAGWIHDSTFMSPSGRKRERGSINGFSRNANKRTRFNLEMEFWISSGSTRSVGKSFESFFRFSTRWSHRFIRSLFSSEINNSFLYPALRAHLKMQRNLFIVREAELGYRCSTFDNAYK